MTNKKNRRSSGQQNEKGQANQPKGLHNLGNTCFFNSALQCLSRVTLLRDWILHFQRFETPVVLKKPNDEGDTETLKFTLNKLNGPLCEAYAAFVSELLGPENNRSSINPGMLRAEMIKQYSRFDGFGQHDSHEALRCLLDGLRNEELKLWQRGILDSHGYNEQASDEVKANIRAWGKSTSLSTTVDRLFGGVMLTSLTCSQCDNVLQHFEVILDLSLPIVEEVEEVAYRKQRPNGVMPKSKNELKKERKAKEKRGRRKGGKQSRRFQEEEEEAEPMLNGFGDDEGDDASEKPKGCGGGGSKRSRKKGKYSKNRQEPRSPSPDGNDENGEDDAGEKVHRTDGEEEVEDEESHTASTTKGQEDDVDGIKKEEGVDEEETKTEIKIEVDSCKEDTEDGEETFATPSAVNCKKEEEEDKENLFDTENDKEEEEEVEAEESKATEPPQEADFHSAGESADVEDNDEQGSLSDISAPQPANQPASLEHDLATKLRISEAGSSASAVALPTEEAQAKSLSQLPIIATTSRTTAVTDLERHLARYTAPEALTGSNQTICEVCTKRAGGGGGGKGGKPSVRCDSVKRDLIIRPPAVLTIHLKRFQQMGFRLQKCSKNISFPLYLDMRPYCSRLAKLSAGEGQYRLLGVVEHSGHLRSGHYVCYVAEEGSKASTTTTSSSSIPDPRFVPSLEKPEAWPMFLHHLVYQLRRGDRRVVAMDEPDGEDTTAAVAPENGTDEEHNDLPTDTRRWFYCSDSHVAPTTLSAVLSCQPYVLLYERIR